MTTKELANELAKELEIAKSSAHIITLTFVDLLKKSILEGKEVNLHGVCKMGLVHEKNRKFTTNLPGEPVHIKPVYSRLYCKFTKTFKNIVQAKANTMNYDEIMRAQAIANKRTYEQTNDVKEEVSSEFEE